MSDQPKWRTRERDICLTHKDLEDFTEVVRARFPDLYIYETSNIQPAFRELRNFGEGSSGIVFSPTRPRPGPSVSMYQSDGVWFPRIRNQPQIVAEIYRTTIETWDLRTIEPGEAIHPIDAAVRRLRPGGFMRGIYRVGEEDRRRFIHSVFYMAGKFMTNDFDAYDLETGERHHTLRQSLLWAGPDAMRLGEIDRDFYCVVYFAGDLNTWVGYKAIPRVRKKPRKKKRGTE